KGEVPSEQRFGLISSVSMFHIRLPSRNNDYACNYLHPNVWQYRFSTTNKVHHAEGNTSVQINVDKDIPIQYFTFYKFKKIFSHFCFISFDLLLKYVTTQL
ncbi:MAG: hypothetical protein ABJA71_14330, partial [Ginsengibacter sp.]